LIVSSLVSLVSFWFVRWFVRFVIRSLVSVGSLVSFSFVRWFRLVSLDSVGSLVRCGSLVQVWFELVPVGSLVRWFVWFVGFRLVRWI
jgi:hypothetical protein